MRYIIPILLLILLVACPKPVEELDPAICEDGYHPCGPDSQECCLDTTSFTFTWVADTFGVYGTEIRDVAIIAEDNIWVVGLINVEVPDTSQGGTKIETFNLIRFDGEQWHYSKIGLDPYPGLTYCIWVINENDIWFSMRGSPVHWNGQTYTEYYPGILNYPTTARAIKRIWAASSDDVYFVGHNGTFLHFDGIQFETIETSTYMNIVDIQGTTDGKHLYLECYQNPGDPAGCAILHYDVIGQEIRRLYYAEHPNTQGLYGWVSGLGIKPDNELLVGSDDGLLVFNTQNFETTLILNSESYIGRNYTSEYGSIGLRDILWSGPNDIFFAGFGFKYIQYNGIRFQPILDIYEQWGDCRIEAADRLNDLYVLVGYESGWQYGIVVRMWKH